MVSSLLSVLFIHKHVSEPFIISSVNKGTLQNKSLLAFSLRVSISAIKNDSFLCTEVRLFLCVKILNLVVNNIFNNLHV